MSGCEIDDFVGRYAAAHFGQRNAGSPSTPFSDASSYSRPAAVLLALCDRLFHAPWSHKSGPLSVDNLCAAAAASKAARLRNATSALLSRARVIFVSELLLSEPAAHLSCPPHPPHRLPVQEPPFTAGLASSSFTTPTASNSSSTAASSSPSPRPSSVPSLHVHLSGRGVRGMARSSWPAGPRHRSLFGRLVFSKSRFPLCLSRRPNHSTQNP
jgi:hypothetical protein